MADLGIIFLGRRYPIHWYQSLFTCITGSMPFHFLATLYTRQLSSLLSRLCWHLQENGKDTLKSVGFIIKFMAWWSNLTKCGLFLYTLPPSVFAVHGFPWYRSSHPDPQQIPQLQIWLYHRSDATVGEQKNSQLVLNQEYMDQPAQNLSHSEQSRPPQTCVQKNGP